MTNATSAQSHSKAHKGLTAGTPRAVIDEPMTPSAACGWDVGPDAEQVPALG
jgi:hypothetical protein